MEACLQEGVVLDLDRVNQNLLTVTVVTVLSSFKPLSVLVHVKTVRKYGHCIILCTRVTKMTDPDTIQWERRQVELPIYLRVRKAKGNREHKQLFGILYQTAKTLTL